MSKRYLTLTTDGGLSITQSIGDDPDGKKVTKALFELSRTTDMDTHFDPEIHTREAIASGLEGHRVLSLLGECEDTDLPTDRYFRDAWEWED
jgi:hypothetical protein